MIYLKSRFKTDDSLILKVIKHHYQTGESMQILVATSVEEINPSTMDKGITWQSLL